MVKNRLLVLLCLLLQFGFIAKAQFVEEKTAEWEVPVYSFIGVPAGDPDGRYVKYNDDIIQCHDWLQNTLIGEQGIKRIEAKKFMVKWSLGCSHVSITIDSKFVYSDRVEQELLVAYVGGWCKYALQHQDQSKEDLMVPCTLAGIEAQLNLYEKNEKAFSSNKDLKKFIKNMTSLKKKNKLEEYVRQIYEKIGQPEKLVPVVTE
ncbi:MAG: hypothetical protein MJZ34_09540 [Paludibacteraceae bacterium]|nr:hypothetical protein [Paludibacteraceae bacterium]